MQDRTREEWANLAARQFEHSVDHHDLLKAGFYLADEILLALRSEREKAVEGCAKLADEAILAYVDTDSDDLILNLDVGIRSLKASPAQEKPEETKGETDAK